MNRLLQALGLMRVSDQPVVSETDWEAKFKKAITDLAAAREEVERLTLLANSLDAERNEQAALIESYRPDALAMRRKRERDRDRRKAVS